MIAPCGMNCGSCIAYMRPKNSCPGCWFVDRGKARVNCVIRNCEFLEKKDSKFCFDCQKFPCQRANHLAYNIFNKIFSGFYQKEAGRGFKFRLLFSIFCGDL